MKVITKEYHEAMQERIAKFNKENTPKEKDNE
jgi:hypothetical protein